MAKKPPNPRTSRSDCAHYIVADLESEPWIAETIAELERYLACWAAFDAFMADRG